MAGFSRALRMSWYDAGTSQSLNAGEDLVLANHQVVVLAKGRLHAEGAGSWFAVEAPAVLTLPGGTRLRAIKDIAMTLLPAAPPTG